MKNKLFLALAGSLTLLPASARPRPNVIYVFPDQMRGSALGFIGDPAYSGFFRTSGDPVRTPNLDAFARESAVLTNAFSSCPVSSPHRGSLLTGMHPHLSGVPMPRCISRTMTDGSDAEASTYPISRPRGE